MKKYKSIFILGLTSLLIVSCKKGENDPLLPFQSRDSRIAGNWELIKIENSDISVYTPVGGTSSTVEYQSTYEASEDGSSANQGTWTELMIVNGATMSTSVKFYEEDLTIEKNGDYTRAIIDDGDNTETTGQWWWLDGTKKKTRIAFDDDVDSYEIDRLANKELVLTRSYVFKETDSDGDVTENTITSKMTYKQF